MKASPETILSELTRLFRGVLADEKLVLTLETTAKDVDGWDSFTHVKLIAAIEAHYDIHFRLKQILKFQNVGDMCRAILVSAP